MLRLSPKKSAAPAARAHTNARVVMLETVTNANTVHGDVIDIGFLLRYMDICTCASAELYARHNCVTVAMSDVAIDYTPKLLDVIELVAEPVLIGHTSLEIEITVTAERQLKGGRTERAGVCTAHFTYVTVRHEGGEKVVLPPFEPTTEEARWAMVLAESRRKLIKLERERNASKHEAAVPSGAPRVDSALRSRSSHPSDWGGGTPRRVSSAALTAARGQLAPVRGGRLAATLRVATSAGRRGRGARSAARPEPRETAIELTEVVLPPHQNHMGHTFGGIVMHWAHKAAYICAARHAGHASALRTALINRISFAVGSTVSDHLTFQAMVNRVFGGRMLEVGVRVVKRNIGSEAEEKCSAGYFVFEHADAARTPPIPPLAEPRHDDEGALGRAARATRRYHYLTARKQLLTNVGGVPTWDDSLAREAAMLTLESLLRLHQSQALTWMAVRAHRPPGITAEHRLRVAVAAGCWGRASFVLRVTGRARGARGAAPSVAEALDVARTRRPEWDPACIALRLLQDERTGAPLAELAAEGEEGRPAPTAALGEGWEVVRFERRLPTALATAACTGHRTLLLSLLRAWRVSALDGSAMLASRSVRHPRLPRPHGEVLPSGFLMRPVRMGDADAADADAARKAEPTSAGAPSADAGLELTYVVEIELKTARRTALYMPDRFIVVAAARSCAETLAGLIRCLEGGSAERRPPGAAESRPAL